MSVSGVDTGLVVGQFVIGIVDGADEDAEPDLIGARGTVEFSPVVNYVPIPLGAPNPFTLLKDTFVAILDDEGYICTPDPDFPMNPGTRGIRLFATDSEDASVKNWTWKVTPKFNNTVGRPIASYIAPFDIAVPTDGIVDLATAVKIPSSPGLGTEQVVVFATKASDAAVYAARQAEYAAEEASSAGISAWEATEIAQQALAVSALAEEAATGVQKQAEDGEFVPKISVGTVTTVANPADDVWMSNIIKNSPLVSTTLREVFPTTMQGAKGDTGTGWNAIAANDTNLNNLGVGVARQFNGNQGTILNNYPFNGFAGVIITSQWGSSTELLQEAHSVPINNRVRGVYKRGFRAGAWSPWSFLPTQRVDNTAGLAIYTWDDSANREQLIYGDTGVRNIVDYIDQTKWNPSVAKIRRVGSSVELRLSASPLTGNTGNLTLFTQSLPSGFHNPNSISGFATHGSVVATYNLSYGGGPMSVTPVTSTSSVGVHLTYQTVNPWPTTLPGTADGTIPNL